MSVTKPSGSAGRRARREVDPVRLAAYDLLVAVATDDAYANLLLPGLLADRGIVGRDAAFATELTYGALRGQGTYDAVLEACVDRPLDELDPTVLAVLRLGAHQLLATRVPAHAAVATSVEVARAAVGEGPARLVNAVLRRVAARPLDDWMVRLAPDPDDDPIGHLAVRHSHPAWVVQAFADALGGDLAQVSQLLAADNDPPSVTLVVRPGRAEVSELLESGAEPGRWSPYAAVLTAGQPREVPAVAEGRAGVQDEGSQLVALALARADLTTGEDTGRWMDMCAGPGGKAALLAGLAAERDAALLAVERQQHRTRLVRDALRGSRGTWAAVTADAIRSGWVDGGFDRVLADVPCTGLGALRRRPEARWRRRPSDLATLAPLQRGLLHAAVRAARPGGLVAYVACSPHLAETRGIVADVLAARDDVEQVDARAYVDVPDLGDGPHVQLWPHRHGTDAMFLALFRRTR
jgi:16S rRNA (cytosine967-C5)-methyltransferase